MNKITFKSNNKDNKSKVTINTDQVKLNPNKVKIFGKNPTDAFKNAKN